MGACGEVVRSVEMRVAMAFFVLTSNEELARASEMA